MKLLFGLIIGAAIVVSVIALYCALIIAGRSDDQAEKKNSEGDDDMFLKKRICPRCKTGKYTYDLDPKSEACPYIGCWRRNKCSFYKPLDKHSKSRACKKGKSDDMSSLKKIYNMIRNSV